MGFINRQMVILNNSVCVTPLRQCEEKRVTHSVDGRRKKAFSPSAQDPWDEGRSLASRDAFSLTADTNKRCR